MNPTEETRILIRKSEFFYVKCNAMFINNLFSSSDINECEGNGHKCDANAKCWNTIGSYTCACKRGYIGDGFHCGE